MPVFVVEANMEERLIDQSSDWLHQVGRPALVPAGPKMHANDQGFASGYARPTARNDGSWLTPTHHAPICPTKRQATPIGGFMVDSNGNCGNPVKGRKTISCSDLLTSQ